MMSQNQLMNKKDQNQEDDQVHKPLIDAYEAQIVNELKQEQKLREFYTSLDFPCCGDYLQPNMNLISERKRTLNKEFVEGKQIEESLKIIPNDGIYEHNQAEKEASTDLIRLKTRLARDVREEYFSKTGTFVIQKEFFQEQLSRLANISYFENYSIKTYQKNAILSERNNQKKSVPFQLQINIGCIWFLKHELQNDEQRKFEELSEYFREYSIITTYPTIAEIDHQIAFLKSFYEGIARKQIDDEDKQELERKIEIAQRKKEKYTQKLQTLMKKILDCWKEVKAIRREKNMITVPFKLNGKQYEVEADEGRKVSFDLGFSSTEINEKPTGPGAPQQIKRRNMIKAERYYIKIYVNGNQMARSEKINMQWPSFKVPFNQKYSVVVYSGPSQVQVEIIKSGLIDSIVDTINLTIPGINSKTITSSEQRYAAAQFSSNGVKYRKSEEDPKPPSGLVVYCIEWKGQGAKMPSLSHKLFEEETVDTDAIDQEVNYPEIFDIKDPRFPQKPKREKFEEEIIYEKGALLPFINIQSTRHLLLKMKSLYPELLKIQIPLLEEQISKRQDLMGFIDKQKTRVEHLHDIDNQNVYSPMQGMVFETQMGQVLRSIRAIILQIQNRKTNAMKGTSVSSKYKITEEILKQYTFEEMQSPLVVCIKNIFTQHRKLGPQVTQYEQPKTVIDELQVNLHVRSAKNVPIRESAFSKIKKLKDEEAGSAIHGGMGGMGGMGVMGGMPQQGAGNMDMYRNFGMGLYNRQPNIGMGNQGWPGMMPNFGRGMQVNYQKKTLERNSTFIQMRFKKFLKRTEAFEGPYPEWNETLQIKYKLKQSSMTIEKIYTNQEKSMKIFLYDIIQESKGNRNISETIVKRRKYFLGRIEVPFSMFPAIPSLTGMFKIERPFVLFGYGVKEKGILDQQDVVESKKTERPNIHTFINLDIFTDPLINSITAYNSDRKFVSGDQDTLLLQRASDWIEDLNTKRYIRLWLNNLEGKSVFICRYLSDEIAPPPGFNNNFLIEKCARYVSLIPRKYNCTIMQNTEEFHLTCKQLLQVKMGEDHGILLCNYFNYVDRRQGRNGIQSYLLIGKAFPYGKSIFVLRRDLNTNDCQIWDPFEGQCCFFPAKEYETFCCFFSYRKQRQMNKHMDSCNMLQVGCVVAHDNVYINIQESLKPIDIDFNLEDDTKWKPFLSDRIRNQYFQGKMDSIQQPLDYPKMAGSELQRELELKITNEIKQNLKKDRAEHIQPHFSDTAQTRINNEIRQKLLPHCEILKTQHRVSGMNSSLYIENERDQKDKYEGAVEDLQKQKNQIKGMVDAEKNFYGFSINTGFTTIKDIWERIQQTHFHLDQDQNMKFIISVRCFQYQYHLFSVWVFVGSIS